MMLLRLARVLRGVKTKVVSAAVQK